MCGQLGGRWMEPGRDAWGGGGTRGPPAPEVGEGWRSGVLDHLSIFLSPTAPFSPLVPSLLPCFFSTGSGGPPCHKTDAEFRLGEQGLFKNVNWIVSSPLLKIL